MNATLPRCLIIAEAGVNHNGSLPRALELIDAAAQAGADVVKFQTFVPEEAVSRRQPKAEYQKMVTKADESMLDMVRGLRLDEEAHFRLVERCAQRGIAFLSTPFDHPSLAFLTATLDIDTLKLPSGEITNTPLMLAAARTQRKMLVSTGMCTLGEVEQALGVLAFGLLGHQGRPTGAGFAAAFASAEGRAALAAHVTLLHCTTEYPAPFADVNLRAMDTMKAAFGLPVGLSDHTPGIAVAIAAVARGAVIVEKHFTLNRTLPGPDHQASIEPVELAAMVRSIREVEAALGDGIKVPRPSEIPNIAIARKCLVARTAIAAGRPFCEANLAVKRAGGGVSPDQWWTMLDRVAARDYEEDEPLDP